MPALTKQDLYDIAWNALCDAQDIDVGLNDLARAAVDALIAEGAIGDTAGLQARLRTIEERAGRLSAHGFAHATLRLTVNGYAASVCILAGATLEGTGDTADAALSALENALGDRDPDLAWATLGCLPGGRLAA